MNDIFKELCSFTPQGSFVESIDSPAVYQALDSLGCTLHHKNIIDMHSYCNNESFAEDYIEKNEE
jgi:hypothetical protein